MNRWESHHSRAPVEVPAPKRLEGLEPPPVASNRFTPPNIPKRKKEGTSTVTTSFLAFKMWVFERFFFSHRRHVAVNKQSAGNSGNGQCENCRDCIGNQPISAACANKMADVSMNLGDAWLSRKKGSTWHSNAVNKFIPIPQQKPAWRVKHLGNAGTSSICAEIAVNARGSA